MIENNNIDNIIRIIHKFYEESQKISEEYKHLNGNILDCLYLKEPHHSRILAGILNYYSNNEPEILRSFIMMLSEKCKKIESIISYLKNTEIVTEKMNIDCLVSYNKNYAIIIENKIYDAVDQNKQIERYIESVRKVLEIDKENIYVVYLTKDGNKKIDEWSFTDEAKKNLDYNENDNGRFIELNYKDDILPWLKKIVLELRNKDHLLIEFIDQYIDKLNGEFRLREIDKGEDKLLEEKLYNVLGIKEKDDKEKISKLIEMKKEIKYISDKVDNSINKIIKKFYNFEYNNYEYLTDELNINNYYWRIFIKELPKKFHFELNCGYDNIIEKINENKIRIDLHDETADCKYQKELIEDENFNKMVIDKKYVIKGENGDVMSKEICFNAELIDVISDKNNNNYLKEEYKAMNEIAKYLIDKFNKQQVNN